MRDFGNLGFNGLSHLEFREILGNSLLFQAPEVKTENGRSLNSLIIFYFLLFPWISCPAGWIGAVSQNPTLQNSLSLKIPMVLCWCPQKSGEPAQIHGFPGKIGDIQILMVLYILCILYILYIL